MSPSRSIPTLLVLLAGLAIGAQALWAQQPPPPRDPHIGYVYPAGGQRGTVVEVLVGGQFLGGTNDVLVSGGGGVKATVIKINQPIPRKRLQELRDYVDQARKKMMEASMPPPVPQPNAQPAPQSNVQAAPQPNVQPIPQPNATPTPQLNAQPASQANAQPAQPNTTPTPRPPPPRNGNAPLTLQQTVTFLKEAGATDDEIKGVLEMRKKNNDPKRQQNLQLNETVVLRIEIAADAPLGPRELRLLKPMWVTNPLAFCIGQWPEQVNDSSGGKTFQEKAEATPTPVTLPVVVNGQILPGAVDGFSFHAVRGEHLVIATQGRDLMPYLADAVPGWFQPALTLYNEKGSEVAFADHFYFNTDPLLYYEVPEDGTYRLEVRDLLYRGREDFVYRIMIGDGPFVRDIFPLGGPAGVATSLSVTGWNLPRTKITFKSPGTKGVYPVAELSNGYATRNVLFASDTLPECLKTAPVGTPKQAQHVTLPMVVNGRIDSPGDVDVFSISCHAGEQVVAEVYARRLNSPLDSWLRVTDATGKQLAFNDDNDDKGAGLLTQQADSYLTFTAPADGLYFIHLGDSLSKGGPEYAYRLRISEPMPDFALYATPSGITGRPGAKVPLTVQAVRKDGFTGDISLALKDAPAGFVLEDGKIPAGQDKVRATVTFPQATALQVQALTLEGHATIGSTDVVHPVVATDEMIQAFMYHHLVPANELVALVAVPPGRTPVTVVTPAPIK